MPFGLRSAPLIFTTIADAVQWMMSEKVFHYLDDFITLGPPSSHQSQCNLQGIIQVCKVTGTPLEEDKCQGPAQVLTFLGIELDTRKMEIRLPVEKLERLRNLLAEWEGRKAGKKRELLGVSTSQQR